MTKLSKMERLFRFSIPLFLLLSDTASAQQDTVHFSRLFNSWRPYRIYLPSDYNRSQKKYPVIYYFHGNQGDEKFYMDGVQQLVDDASVILVAWNGRSVMSDMRPYNAGYHSNVNYPVQFKDYFLEFSAYIDSAYRTRADREHRGLIGHSMGGFMSFFLAGKYPQMVCAAVSAKGSPEFFVGHPDNHTLYHTRYMFGNLQGVKIKFDNGTEGEELHNLNNEVNAGAKREQGLDYSYQAYEGGHAMQFPEFSDAFRFVLSAFKNPLPQPVRWHHADLYPKFSVWDYEISSNLNQPGYIDMKGVTRGGLEIRTRKWEPDGVLIPDVRIHVNTAALYKPNTDYSLFDFNVTKNTRDSTTTRSDEAGRIHFAVDGNDHQIGIREKNALPEIVFLAHKVNGLDIFLTHKKQCSLKLCLLNRGGSAADKISISLTSSKEAVVVENPVVELAHLGEGELRWLPVDFLVTASNAPTTDGSPFRVRFNLVMTDKNGNRWTDEFDAPVYYDVPAFMDIGIDDGDSEIFGSGNGNNISEPGETVMIYQHSNRTRLYYDDPYIDDERLHDDLQPDKWGDGYSLSSLIHIAKDCPIGHRIKFLACYEIKEWKTIKRDVTWGTFTITVGKASLSGD